MHQYLPGGLENGEKSQDFQKFLADYIKFLCAKLYTEVFLQRPLAYCGKFYLNGTPFRNTFLKQNSELNPLHRMFTSSSTKQSFR